MLNKMTGEGSTAIDANTLCQECGICCDGTLFSFVKVYPEEITKMKELGIPVYKNQDGHHIFDQACPCFKNGNCSAYLKRPRKCHSFSCKLQKDVMNGSMKFDDALKIVELVKKHTVWVRDAIVSKAKPNKKVMNYRVMLYDYHKAAVDKSSRNELSIVDEGRIKRVFEQIKLIDRFFEDSSLLRRYADLIQSFKIR